MPLSRLSEFHPADIKKSDKASENASTSHSKNLIPGIAKDNMPLLDYLLGTLANRFLSTCSQNWGVKETRY